MEGVGIYVGGFLRQLYCSSRSRASFEKYLCNSWNRRIDDQQVDHDLKFVHDSEQLLQDST